MPTTPQATAGQQNVTVCAIVPIHPRSREAQWRPCRLETDPLQEVASWVEPYRQFWEENLDAQWWGPKGFTTRVDEMDLRPGGQSRYVMVGPDSTEYPAKGVFREVVPLERIVATDEFGEGYDQTTDIDLPQGMVTTVLFEDLGNQTQLTLKILHPTTEDLRKHEEMGVVAGWNSTLDCLAEHLATVLV